LKAELLRGTGSLYVLVCLGSDDKSAVKNDSGARGFLLDDHSKCVCDVNYELVERGGKSPL